MRAVVTSASFHIKSQLFPFPKCNNHRMQQSLHHPFYSHVPVQRPLYCCTKLVTLESNRFEDILDESIDENGLSKLSVYKRCMLD